MYSFPDRSNFKNHLTALIVTLVTTLLAHFPLLLSDSVMWDGTIIHKSLIDNDFSILSDWLTSERHPQRAWISWATRIFPDVVFGHKFFSFVSLWLGSYFLAASLELALGISLAESLIVAVITLVLPVYVLYFELVMTPYTVAFFFFWLGSYLLLRHMRTATAKMCVFTPLLIPAAAALFMAFCVESFLFFFFGILALACIELRKKGHRPKSILMASGIPGLFPILYISWVKTLTMPLPQLYGSYNRIGFPPDLHLIARAFKHSLHGILNGPLVILKNYLASASSVYTWIGVLIVSTAATCVIVAVLKRFLDAELFDTQHERTRQGHLLLSALLLLALALFPYAILGKFVTATGVGTRQGFLTHLPLALATYAIILPLFRLLKQRRMIAYMGIALFLLPCVFLTLYNQVLWQNRYIKYQGVIQGFRDLESLPEKIVILTDNTQFGYPEKLRFYEINWMLWRTFGNDSRMGLDSSDTEIEIPDLPFRKYSSMTHFDLPSESIPHHPKSSFVVESTADNDELKIYLNYYYARMRGQLPDYLRSLVSLKSGPTL